MIDYKMDNQPSLKRFIDTDIKISQGDKAISSRNFFSFHHVFDFSYFPEPTRLSPADNQDLIAQKEFDQFFYCMLSALERYRKIKSYMINSILLGLVALIIINAMLLMAIQSRVFSFFYNSWHN